VCARLSSGSDSGGEVESSGVFQSEKCKEKKCC